jgi:hypothetical protein
MMGYTNVPKKEIEFLIFASPVSLVGTIGLGYSQY